MSRWSLAAALLVAFVAAPSASAAPPPDAFCVILFEPDEGFGRMTVLVDLETNLTERQQLFGQLDLDSDGTVDPMEQERLRSSTVRLWNGTDSLGVKGLTMAGGDGTQQWGATFLGAKTWTQVGHTFHKQHATTPAFITDPADLETQEVRELYFEHRGTPTKAVVSGGQDPAAPWPEPTGAPTTTTSSSSTSPTYAIEYVVVRAPEGWIVESASGQSYEGRVTTYPGVREADLPAFDTTRPFFFRFEKAPPATTTTSHDPSTTGTTSPTAGVPTTTAGGERGAAGPALATVAAALALALLARRRLP